MHDLNTVLSALERTGCNLQNDGQGFRTSCPSQRHAHGNKKNPALTIAQMGSKVLMFCHAGCEYDELLGEIGLANDAPISLEPPKVHIDIHKKPSVKYADLASFPTVYKYANENGVEVIAVARTDDKRFFQCSRKDDKWIYGLTGYNGSPRPLYNLPSILSNKHEPIIIHEGEKAAEAATAAGLTGIHTTTIGGSGNCEKTDFSVLVGRFVFAVPDNDEAGVTHAEKLAENIEQLKIIYLPNIPEKGDIVEWLEKGNSNNEWNELLSGSSLEHEVWDEEDNNKVIEPIPARLKTTPVAIINDIKNWFDGIAEDVTDVASLTGALAVTSSIAGRRYYSVENNVTTSYSVLIMNTGVGKDYVRKGSVRLLVGAGLDKLLTAGDFSGDSALISVLKEHPNKLIVSDEFGDKLKKAFAGKQQQGSSFFTLLKEGFSSADDILMGKSLSTLSLKSGSDASTHRINWPGISLLGLTTPEQFTGALDAAHIEGGLLNRFLCVVGTGETVKTNDTTTRAVPEHIIQFIKRVHEPSLEGNMAGVNTTYDQDPQIVRVNMPKESRDIFKTFKRTVKDWAGSNAMNIMLSQRLREIAMRMATNLATWNNPEQPFITTTIAEWACDYTFFHGKRSVEMITKGMFESEYEQERNTALTKLRTQGEVGLTVFAKFPGVRGKGKRQRDDMISDMIDRGEVAKRKGSVGGKNCKPVTYIYATREL